MEEKVLAGDFTQGSIANKLIRFMIPILGALVLQAMYTRWYLKIHLHHLILSEYHQEPVPVQHLQ